MVKQAQETRSRTQDLANRAALWLTYIALSVGGATLIAWLSLGQSFDFALERMVTVMVITCPHALGLAVPLVVAVSTSLTAKNGLLIRDRAAFERARNLQAVVFDKTGTLTEGRFGVSNVMPLGDLRENDMIAWAASLEAQSQHPIARGIVESAKERNIALKSVDGFHSLTGRGAEATIEGRDVKVVSPGYLREQGIEAGNEDVKRIADEGKTVVYVLLDDEVVGAVALADIIRKESYTAVRRLKEMAIQCRPDAARRRPDGRGFRHGVFPRLAGDSARLCDPTDLAPGLWRSTIRLSRDCSRVPVRTFQDGQAGCPEREARREPPPRAGLLGDGARRRSPGRYQYGIHAARRVDHGHALRRPRRRRRASPGAARVFLARAGRPAEP
jgi:hypothetical protein